MTNIQIQSEQEFTYDGRVGAFLFICGPIVSVLGYAWLLNELTSSYASSADLAPPFVVVATGGVALLSGCVMILVGRTYRHVVTVQQSDRAADPQAMRDGR
ncbi:hypothetical protein [Mesorhizobium caraganae]|uniref:hypothetical protein n=1 Tax=Mesorhizobium caraganae TaxID=483206 RepID=UPI003ECE149F